MVLGPGLLSSRPKFDRLAAFPILHNGLKLLATKLQKRNQHIYHAHHMIDQVIIDFKDTKRATENEFK